KSLLSKPRLNKVANASIKLAALNSPINGACSVPSPN
ncbi:hypothetical protein D037_1330B, partial [Vibrio parahaemolyticus IDH02640]